MDDMVLPPRHGLSLCAGGGGLDMGLMLAEPGFHTRCFVEWEEYPRQAIIAAQRAGYFAPAPIWDDVTTFDGRPFRGAFDTILAGYPCQPFSHAGQRRGADDDRHLWPDVARIIREVEPEWVFLENVAGHVSLGAEAVLRELWDMGWTPAAGLFSASETGAPHERLRWFCVAHRDDRMRTIQPQGSERDEWGWIGDGSDRVADPGGGRCAGSDEGQDQQPQGAEAIGSGGAMADASGAERQRQQPGQRDARGRQEPHGHPARPGGTGLFPPGPEDADAWAAVLQVDAGAAPALGRGGTVQASKKYISTACSADTRCSAQPGSGSLAGRRELSAVEREAAEILGAETVAAVRRLTDGLAARSRSVRLLGNGVPPLAAGYAWRALSAAHGLGCVDLEAASGTGGTDANGPFLTEAAE